MIVDARWRLVTVASLAVSLITGCSEESPSAARPPQPIAEGVNHSVPAELAAPDGELRYPSLAVAPSGEYMIVHQGGDSRSLSAVTQSHEVRRFAGRLPRATGGDTFMYFAVDVDDNVWFTKLSGPRAIEVLMCPTRDFAIGDAQTVGKYEFAKYVVAFDGGVAWLDARRIYACRAGELPRVLFEFPVQGKSLHSLGDQLAVLKRDGGAYLVSRDGTTTQIALEYSLRDVALAHDGRLLLWGIRSNKPLDAPYEVVLLMYDGLQDESPQVLPSPMVDGQLAYPDYVLTMGNRVFLVSTVLVDEAADTIGLFEVKESESGHEIVLLATFVGDLGLSAATFEGKLYLDDWVCGVHVLEFGGQETEAVSADP